MQCKNLVTWLIGACGLLSAASAVPALGQVPISSVTQTLRFGVETPLPDPTIPEVVDYVHTDIDILYSACAWAFAIAPHDQPPTPENPDGTRRIDLEDALLYVNAYARWNLSSIPPSFAFLGAVPGEDFWILPQSSDPNILYLGFASENMTSSDLAALVAWNPGDPRGGANVEGKWFRIQLVDMRGPEDGHFSMWRTGASNSPEVFMSTYEGGITEQDVYHHSAGSHIHVNWGFTQPGYYEVDIRVSTYIPGQLNAPRFDADGDGDVDMSDFGAWQRCYSGPGVPYACGCEWADGDGDGDVDADDFALFAACFSGPAVPADPACHE